MYVSDYLCCSSINDSPLQSLDAVYDSLRSRDVSFQVDKEYDSPGLLVGAVLTVKVRRLIFTTAYQSFVTHTSTEHCRTSFKLTQLHIINAKQDAIALQNCPGIIAIRPVTTFQRPQPVSVQVVSGPYDPAIPPDSESTHILTVRPFSPFFLLSLLWMLIMR